MIKINKTAVAASYNWTADLAEVGLSHNKTVIFLDFH